MQKKIDFKELQSEAKQTPKNTNGARMFTKDFAKKVIQYHFETGKHLSVISQELDLHQVMLSQWKKKHGKERTVFAFGEGIRNDVRTKALAVEEVLDYGKTRTSTATKYGVADVTIGYWIKQFRDDYKYTIENTQDGVPYLVKKEKMIYGDENIIAILKLKEQHTVELNTIMDLMHANGMTNKLIKEVKIKQKENDAEIETLKKANDIIKKTKK